MSQKFSVLLSIYKKEKPEYLVECFDSILDQTLLPNEIVLVKDGELTTGLEKVIDSYIEIFEEKEVAFQVVSFEENQGLGKALAEGIKHCTYDWVARMDTDDICVKERFEKQMAYVEEHPKTDVLGGYIAEFSLDEHHIESVREVPLSKTEIYRYQRKRDAFNHMTVLLRKETVLKVGNYKHALLMEDSLLWANMIKHHANLANLGEVLVYARTGDAMIKRRGGFSYFKKYRTGRRQILETKTISYGDYLVTVVAQFIVCIVPTPIRTFIFHKILRK